MTKTEKATEIMENWARDDSHGYDQTYRWGQYGDYDCSSAVIQAWENAGVPVKSNGASYTGNMYTVFIRCGFKDVTSQINLATGAGLKRGDVLLNSGAHTAMYCGDGKEVEASINEFGGITGGQPGDQTGWEFLIRPYRNYPWNFVLRYPEAGDYTFTVHEIKKGATGKDVYLLQSLLKGKGYRDQNGKVLKLDRSFGKATEAALKKYQTKWCPPATGVCDQKTWKKILGV